MGLTQKGRDAVKKELDTEVPDSPTTDSINERVKAIDILTEAGGDGDLASIKSTVEGITTLTAAQVNTEVDNALDTAIPALPTADSINQRLKAIDELIEASGAGDLAAMKTAVDALNNLSAAQVNTEVDNALDTAIPVSPTDSSINDILDKAGIPRTQSTANITAADITLEQEVTAGSRYAASNEFIRVRFVAKNVNGGGAGCTLTIRVTRDTGVAEYEVVYENVDVSPAIYNADHTSAVFRCISGDDYAFYITSDDVSDTIADVDVEFLAATG